MKVSVKEKLHEYIDNADDKKVKAIYTLVENEIEDRSSLYDEATINYFREISKDYTSGKIKGYTLEESMKRVRKKIAHK